MSKQPDNIVKHANDDIVATRKQQRSVEFVWKTIVEIPDLVPKYYGAIKITISNNGQDTKDFLS